MTCLAFWPLSSWNFSSLVTLLPLVAHCYSHPDLVIPRTAILKPYLLTLLPGGDHFLPSWTLYTCTETPGAALPSTPFPSPCALSAPKASSPDPSTFFSLMLAHLIIKLSGTWSLQIHGFQSQQLPSSPFLAVGCPLSKPSLPGLAFTTLLKAPSCFLPITQTRRPCL